MHCDLVPSGSSKKSDSSAVRSLSLGLLTVLVLIFFGRFIFTGRFFLLRDLIFDFFANEQFYKSHVLNGVFPLWNPFTGGGEPFVSNIENAVFYPPNLLILVFPVPTANVILTMLHVLLAAWGVWLACRTWRISPGGAVLASTAFAFSTQTVTRIEYYSFFCGYCWYPLVVALYCRWLRRGSLRRFLLVALAMGMQFMAGYPEAVMFSGLTLALLGGFFGVVRWRMGGGFQGAVKPLAGLAGMSALVLVLCAVQILPVLDILAYTPRDEMGPALGQASFHPVMVLTTLFPYLFGTPGFYGKYWAPGSIEFWMSTCYVGILPIILCLVALWRKVVSDGGALDNQDDPLSRFRVEILCLILFFFLLYAMGGYTPFYPYLYDTFPILRLFRWPTKSLMCISFAVSCLAGIAVDILMAGEHGRLSGLRRWMSRWLPITACLFLALFMLICLVNRGALGRRLLYRYFDLGVVPADFVERIPWSVIVDQAWIFIGIMLMTAALLRLLFSKNARIRSLVPWGMIAVVFIDLALTTYPLLPSSDMDIMHNKGPYKEIMHNMSTNASFWRPSSQQFLYGVRNEKLLRLARDTFAGSWAMVDRVRNARPNGAFPFRDYSILLYNYSLTGIPESSKERLGKILGISFWIDAALTPAYFKEGDINRPVFYRIRYSDPPATVAGGVKVIPDSMDLLQVLVSESWKRLSMALATEIPPSIDPSLVGRAEIVNHSILRYDEGENRLTIEVESEKPGILVTTESYYPGWDATVNGKDTPVFKADFAFRSVVVPHGRSVVEMEFRPRTLFPGLIISLAALVLTLGTAVLVNGRPRRNES